MAQFVYTMHRVGKVVPPKRHILKNISLSFFPGAKIGVLGLNGAGKSTLLRIMAGIDTDIEGEARPQPGIKIGYLPQEPQLNPEHTVRESIEEAVSEVVNALKRLDEVYALYADPDADFDKLAAEQGRLEEIIQAHDGHNLNVQLERAADALRLPDWDAKIANLSGGERRRVALCRLLLEKPDMLLLDEPTNHLDAESVAWLERFLHDFEGTVVAITHDRYFLDNVAGWILELDRGEGIPWEGNYSSWLEQKDQRLAQEASQEAARRKSIEKELEWVRQGTKGRQSKGKARLARFEELNSTEYQKRNETNELFIPPGPRLGDKVLEVSNLRKSYGDRLLIDDLSFSIPKGAIVGIIGPNGAGKSTTFKMMCGLLVPTSGQALVLGMDLKESSGKARQHLGYMAQKFSLYGNLTVEQNLRFFSGVYGLRGRAQNEKISRMSEAFGLKSIASHATDELPLGFKQRLALACSLMHEPDILFLDEPTSGVDPITRREFWLHINSMVEKGVTVMVTTHFMDEAEYCDRIGLVYRGKLIASGTPDDLKAQSANDEQPDPTMEQAFIQLIHDWDKEHSNE